MNERIQELAKEAGLRVNPDGEIGPAFFGSVDAGYRRFAELIVRECLTKIENEAEQYAAPVWAFEIVNDIKQHFGVEDEPRTY